MTVKQKLKMIVDLAMTVMLPLLMAYNMIGDAAHEWIGMAIFVLFILHHAFNFRFTIAATKGKYTPERILLTVTDLLLFLDMLCLMISSVMLSRHVFAFLDITAGAAIARTMHLLGSYWGFVLMSVHLGFHVGGIKEQIRKAVHIQKTAKAITYMLTILLSAFGLHEFISRGLPKYMFLKTQFVFFDYSEPIILFLVSYIAIMVLFAAVGYVLFRLLIKIRKKGTDK